MGRGLFVFFCLFLGWGTAARLLSRAVVSTAKPEFDVKIDGKSVRHRWCYTSPAGGLIPEVTGDSSHVVVWDPDAQCSTPGDVYVHYAGGVAGGSGGRETVEAMYAKTQPMTAGKGSTVHTYMAAWYSTLPTNYTGCQHFAQAAEAYLKDARAGPTLGRLIWRVARHGVDYPNASCKQYGGSQL